MDIHVTTATAQIDKESAGNTGPMNTELKTARFCK